jgi:transposase
LALAFTVGLGQKPRLKTIAARSRLSLSLEIRAAKKRFDLPEDALVVCCYEAGRAGFWLLRFPLAHGVQNQVVDSSSIDVNRCQRRAKSDRLDATKLVQMLIRWRNGEHKVRSIVHAHNLEQEDHRLDTGDRSRNGCHQWDWFRQNKPVEIAVVPSRKERP